MEETRTTKIVTFTVVAKFYGNYLDVDEVAGHAQNWIDSGLNDRDDLRAWDFSNAVVIELDGDPLGLD